MNHGPWDVRSEDGPLIVFVHGTHVDRASWGAVVAELGGRLPVRHVDLPGHGARSDEEFTLDAAADVVLDAAIDGAGSRPSVVVRLSLGGYAR